MRKLARSILPVLVLMTATACTSWSDFVAQLEQPSDSLKPVPAIESTSQTMPTLARVYLKAGEKARERGDTETARRFFDKAEELAPGVAQHVAETPSAKTDKPANAAAAAGLAMRATELVKLYEPPSETADEATSLHRHAISHDFFGHYALAQQAYRKALTLAGDDIAIRNNLALSLTLSSAYGDAVREMSHVTASSRATAQHRHTLGMLLQLAFQQENDLKRLHATLRTSHMTDKPRRQAMAPTPKPKQLDGTSALSGIAPASGTTEIENSHADADDAMTPIDADTPDPVAWVVRTVSSMWTELQGTLDTPEGTSATN